MTSTETPAAIVFFVKGMAAPQGSKAFKGMRKSKVTGKQVGILVEMSKNVKPWRAAVHAAGVDYLRRHPGSKISGAVSLEVEFHMPRPSTAPRTLDIRPAVSPDLSKLIRSTEDAITTAGLWEDDGRVVQILAYEYYSVGPDLPKIYIPGVHEPEPGALITIRPVNRAR